MNLVVLFDLLDLSGHPELSYLSSDGVPVYVLEQPGDLSSCAARIGDDGLQHQCPMIFSCGATTFAVAPAPGGGGAAHGFRLRLRSRWRGRAGSHFGGRCIHCGHGFCPAPFVRREFHLADDLGDVFR